MMHLMMKTISYGVIHIIVATIVAYSITGNLAMALGIGLIEPVVQTGIFAIHDYFWEREPNEKHSHKHFGCNGLGLLHHGR